ncbi:hypothetical protein BDZ89DRAFT_1056962 [Hymenopellis radicata]|nr:hypothetical protein BDZ89DRAFT_1056962 [Hymenopellis radicata]
MSSRYLRFYAIPPALLLAIPVLALLVVVAFRRQAPRTTTPQHLAQSFLPIFSTALLSLLIGGFGLAGIHDSQLASTAVILLTLLRLELAACFMFLISDFNSLTNVPRRQLWVYISILSLLISCATISSLISTFLSERVPSLLPPFLYLLFTTLTLPLTIYLLLAPDPRPPSTRSDDDSPPTSPPTATLDFDTPPPSPSSTKRSFGLHPTNPPQPNIPPQTSTIHIPIRFHRDHGHTRRTDVGRDRRGLLSVLLVAQATALLSFALEICVTVLVPGSYTDLHSRMQGEVLLGVWKTSLILRCIESLFLVISCGCMMVVWQGRFCSQVVATRSWITPLTSHRPRHRRQLSTTSSFCSPGLRAKSPVLPLPIHPRPSTPPSPTPKSRSANIFNEIRSSIHSYIQPEPLQPQPARVRYQFPSLNLTFPTRTLPRRSQRVQAPQSPHLDSFNMNDPFAPPSPGLIPRYSVPNNSTAGTTRLSAWGNLTLPVPRHSGTAIIEEARLAEKLLERLDSESQ